MTVVLFFCYAMMVGGVARLAVVTFFGVEFMVEAHHLVKTLVRGAYFPGTVTAVAIAALGALMLSRAWREPSRASAPTLPRRSRAQHRMDVAMKPWGGSRS